MTHLIGVRIKHLLSDFLRGVLGLFLAVFLIYIKGPKHPLKSHIANVSSGHRLDE